LAGIMLTIDVSGLPAGSAVALVATSSATKPDFVLADRLTPRVVAARWHRRNVHVDAPIDLEQHLLSYCQTGGAVSTIGIGGTCLRAQQHSGSLTFLPAGRYVRWWLEAPSEVVHWHLYIAPEALQEAMAQRPVALRLAPLMAVRDAWLDAFFRLLAAEYEACRAAGRLQAFDLVDRLGELLLQRIAGLQRTAREAGESAPQRASPLRPLLLRAVLAHIDAHLTGRLGLEELAAVASMSPDHFVRAFEQATGSTPHRWILEHRLEAACKKLHDSTDHIEDIAHACGFAGAAHFSATFRRHLGVTPSAYRRRS
jgi:AraC family transcriptional regulator